MSVDPAAENERVRRHTPPQELEEIDERIERNIRFFGSQPQPLLTQRIQALEQEWSVERWLETNASVLAVGGALIGLTFKKKWLVLSTVVSGFLLQHAVSGWCPPVPFLRRLGVRTQSEIDREKFALKAVRGDFNNIEVSERRSEPSRKRFKSVPA